MQLSRACGVLLHPTCLPGPFGIGDLGPAAYRYIDWLRSAGATWWQVLPLNPAGPGASPYAALSTFAGNPLLVSPELLIEQGLLTPDDVADCPELSPFAVEFAKVIPYKLALLRRAFKRFERGAEAAVEDAFGRFLEGNGAWLNDFALFVAIRRVQRAAHWTEWPTELAFRRPRALAAWRATHERAVRFEEFCQFLFDVQWRAVRTAARERGIAILGDVPIYVADDSVDVWAHREIFRLDKRGRPSMVAGVPPDYFSDTGQLWGNPLYDWEALEGAGFGWWVERLRAALRLLDAARLDHFRAFAGFWEVPAGETTAVHGRWVPGPGRRLLDAVARAIDEMPFVAEDLGVVTDDVVALREAFELPGMAVLQFAFTPRPRSTFIPYNHRKHLVVYTGTHDNNTTVGWFLGDASTEEKDLVRRYLGSDGHEIHWDMIRAAFASVADLAIVPHQDIAGLGADCRMNTPSTVTGNWRFRLTEPMLRESLRDRFAEQAWLFGRR
jgi:4-alpha-glucanotransferase